MKIRPDWRQRLQKIIGDLGGNEKALSKAAGLNETFLRDTFKKNTTPSVKSAQKLSLGLKVDIGDWFLDYDETGINQSNQHAETANTSIDRGYGTLPIMVPHPQRGTTDKVPVLGMAECGPDGLALWNGEVVDYAPRPPNLVGVEKGYAVFAVGESMEPRYHPGETVYIHPGKPVTPGCYVLVQLHPKEDGEAPRAFLKRLVRRSGTKITVEQFEPAKRFDLKPSEVISMHRVVGSGES